MIAQERKMNNKTLRILGVISSLVFVAIASSYITTYKFQREVDAYLILKGCRIARTELLALDQLKKGQHDLAVSTIELLLYSEFNSIEPGTASSERIKKELQEFALQLKKYPGNYPVFKKEAEDFIKKHEYIKGER